MGLLRDSLTQEIFGGIFAQVPTHTDLHAHLHALEKPWQPPLPADSAFVARTLALIQEADTGAREFADSFRVIVPKKKPKAQKVTHARISPHENIDGTSDGRLVALTGNCPGCGFPKTEKSSGCASCYQRWYRLEKDKGLVVPPIFNRTLLPTIEPQDEIQQDLRTQITLRHLSPNSLQRQWRRQMKLCVGCGCDREDFTPGCYNCQTRHSQRKRKMPSPIPPENDEKPAVPVFDDAALLEQCDSEAVLWARQALRSGYAVGYLTVPPRLDKLV